MAWSAAHGRAGTTDPAWWTALGQGSVPPLGSHLRANGRDALPVRAVGGAVFVVVGED